MQHADVDGDTRRSFLTTSGAGAAFLDADVSQAEVMAVTVESSACPDAPTTDPIFTAELA